MTANQSRAEIMNSLARFNAPTTLMLEVLLDIRDQLQTINDQLELIRDPVFIHKNGTIVSKSGKTHEHSKDR